MREIAPKVREEIARMRGVYPVAPVEVLPPREFAQAVFRVHHGADTAIGAGAACCPDGVVRLVEQELQDRRKHVSSSLPAAGAPADRSAFEGEAMLAYLFVWLRREGDPSLARVGDDPHADSLLQLRLRLATAIIAPERGPFFHASAAWRDYYCRTWGPYQEGLRLALARYLEGGWPAVASAADGGRCPPAPPASD